MMFRHVGLSRVGEVCPPDGLLIAYNLPRVLPPGAKPKCRDVPSSVSEGSSGLTRSARLT